MTFSDTQLAQCKQLLADALQGTSADDLLMRVMSQSKRELVEPELPYVAEQIPELLQQQGAIIERAPGARWLLRFLAVLLHGGERGVDSTEPRTASWLRQLAEITSGSVTEPWLTLITPTRVSFWQTY